MAFLNRKKQLVNWKIQGSIVCRLLLYLGFYNAAVVFLVIVAWGAQASVSDAALETHRAPLASQAAPLVVVMLILLPFILWDLVRLTNRVAGPLYRFQAILKQFTVSGTMTAAGLRKGDLLTEFQQDFNSFAEALHALYPETNPDYGLTGTAKEPTRRTTLELFSPDSVPRAISHSESP